MTPQPTPMHFPIDECAKCTVRGDMGSCLATRCSLHESWYARSQHARITELEAQLSAIGAGGVEPLIAGAGWEPATAAPSIAGETK